MRRLADRQGRAASPGSPPDSRVNGQARGPCPPCRGPASASGAWGSPRGTSPWTSRPARVYEGASRDVDPTRPGAGRMFSMTIHDATWKILAHGESLAGETWERTFLRLYQAMLPEGSPQRHFAVKDGAD